MKLKIDLKIYRLPGGAAMPTLAFMVDRVFRVSFPRPSAKIEISQAFGHFCIMPQANEPEDRGVGARLVRLEERLSM